MRTQSEDWRQAARAAPVGEAVSDGGGGTEREGRDTDVFAGGRHGGGCTSRQWKLTGPLNLDLRPLLERSLYLPYSSEMMHEE